MTKKTPLLSILIAVLLLACSSTDISNLLQPGATPPPIPTLVLPTATPSQAVFPTYTFTPTFIGLNTEIAPTFPPALTATPAPTTTAAATVGVPTAAATGLAGTGFDAINLSSAVFHWGACEPTTVTLTATVTNPAQIASLVLFIRVSNKATGSVTGWDKGTSMSIVGPGVYSRMLNGTHMDVTQDSWIQFQLVGTNSQARVLARSPVYHDALSLSPCQ